MLAAGVLGSHASSLNWILKSGAGAVVSKSFSKEPNDGYKNPTTVAVEGGIINAIGLSSPGVEAFIDCSRDRRGGEGKHQDHCENKRERCFLFHNRLFRPFLVQDPLRQEGIALHGFKAGINGMLHESFISLLTH